MLYCSSFDFADELIKKGFKVQSHELLEALDKGLALKASGVLSYYLSKDNFDANFKDKDGKTALDYSNDKVIQSRIIVGDEEITQSLIMAGAQVYPANYDKICSINPNYTEQQSLSVTAKKYLEVIKSLLLLYIGQLYNKEDEDGEFIVRLPQKMASTSFNAETIHTLKPLIDFIEENVMPDCLDFISRNDISGVCLPFFEYGPTLQ